MAREEIEAAIFRLLDKRAPGASICPSEAARALASSGWRSLMNEVREVAAALAAEGRLEVTQGGRPADPATARGPVRLRLPQGERPL